MVHLPVLLFYMLAYNFSCTGQILMQFSPLCRISIILYLTANLSRLRFERTFMCYLNALVRTNERFQFRVENI